MVDIRDAGELRFCRMEVESIDCTIAWRRELVDFSLKDYEWRSIGRMGSRDNFWDLHFVAGKG